MTSLTGQFKDAPTLGTTCLSLSQQTIAVLGLTAIEDGQLRPLQCLCSLHGHRLRACLTETRSGYDKLNFTCRKQYKHSLSVYLGNTRILLHICVCKFIPEAYIVERQILYNTDTKSDKPWRSLASHKIARSNLWRCRHAVFRLSHSARLIIPRLSLSFSLSGAASASCSANASKICCAASSYRCKVNA